MKKIFITSGVLTLLVFAGIIGLFMYSTKNMCGNEVFGEVNSPSLEFKAVIFQRDCGATTGFTTHVSIIARAEALPNDSGNIFIIDGHPDDTQLEISWASDSELKISKNLTGSELKAEKSIVLNYKIVVSYRKS